MTTQPRINNTKDNKPKLTVRPNTLDEFTHLSAETADTKATSNDNIGWEVYCVLIVFILYFL